MPLSEVIREKKRKRVNAYHVAEGKCLLGIHTDFLRIVVNDFCLLPSCFCTQSHQPIKGGRPLTDSIENGAICSRRLSDCKCQHAWQVPNMGNVRHLNAWWWNWNRPTPSNSCKTEAIIVKSNKSTCIEKPRSISYWQVTVESQEQWSVTSHAPMEALWDKFVELWIVCDSKGIALLTVKEPFFTVLIIAISSHVLGPEWSPALKT